MNTGNDAYFFFEGANQIMNNHILKHEHSFFGFSRQGEHKYSLYSAENFEFIFRVIHKSFLGNAYVYIYLYELI